MRNTIQNNLRRWNDDYLWPENGDEWNGMARHCGVDYETWKQSLIDNFLIPHLSADATVLEIAPGRGRWTSYIVPRCQQLILVDLSPNCIEFCKEQFSSHPHVRYHVNDGESLPQDLDGAVDFVWSFDAFVHMDRNVIRSYLAEIRRTLKPGGTAIIHHAGRTHAWLWLGFLRQWGPLGRHVFQFLSMGRLSGNDGWRSNVSNKLVAQMVQETGMEIVSSQQTWGENEECGVLRYGDYITVMRRPVENDAWQSRSSCQSQTAAA